MPRRGGKGPEGYCTLTISRCSKHNTYVCADCHKSNKNDYLISVPEYKADTETHCRWKGQRKSITKHVKQYHNIKRQFCSYWREGTRPNERSSPVQRPNPIRIPISNPFTQSNRNQPDPPSDDDIHIIEEQPISALISLPALEGDADASSDHIEAASSHESDDNAASQNTVVIPRDDVVDLSTTHSVKISESEFQELMRNRTVFCTAYNTTISVAGTSSLRQTTLAEHSFAGSSLDVIESDNDIEIECKSRESMIPENVHRQNSEWSVLKLEGGIYYFGCKICFEFDSQNRTKYAKETYPISCTLADVVNRDPQWFRCYKTHKEHSATGGHLYAMGYAKKSNVFNREAMRSQIRSYLHILRYHLSELDYTRTLSLLHGSGCFTGDKGLSKHRLKWMRPAVHCALGENVTDCLTKPRPWAPKGT